MRIGISCLFRPEGGSLKNLSQLLSAWRASKAARPHEFTLFASAEARERLASELWSGIEVVCVSRAGGSWLRRFSAEQVELPTQLARREIDILYCPANTMPYRGNTPCVVNFNNIQPFWIQSWRDASNA